MSHRTPPDAGREPDASGSDLDQQSLECLRILNEALEKHNATLDEKNKELETTIADSRRAELELQVKEQAIESSITAMVFCDLEGRITHANRAFLKLAGYDHESEVIGRLNREFSALPENVDDIMHALRTHGQWTGEDRARRKDNTLVDVFLSASLVRDATGAPHCTLATFLDLTERKRLERELIRISDQERRRIGRDLHDVLGSHLTGASMLAQSLALDANEGLPVRPEDLQEVARLVREGARQARALAHGLNPVNLEKRGFSVALEELATATQDNSHLRCIFTRKGRLPALNQETATQLYRIAQEAVHNAVRHAQAHRLCIVLQTTRDALTLTIRDDGVGLPETLPSKAGMGLSIMAYRANMIGAHFRMDSTPGDGTLLRCTVPLRPLLPRTSTNGMETTHVQDIHR